MCASTHHTVATAIEADYMTYNLAQCKNSQAVSKHQPKLPVPLIPIKLLGYHRPNMRLRLAMLYCTPPCHFFFQARASDESHLGLDLNSHVT